MLKKPTLIKGILCLLFLVASVKSFAQTHQSHYTLLWRISGNGLTKPSYLFGTMHVKDSRVFNFSDSVMVAIEKCNGFALEVHPDTIAKIMLDAMQQHDSTSNLRKLLGEKKYEELSKKFAKRNGYPISENMNPLLVESLLQDNKEHPGDKETFVDAYLYGIARTMNKTIHGLEDANQQFNDQVDSPEEIRANLLNLLENNGDEENDTEEMIKLYSTGDLDGILKFANEYNMIDSSIIARNKVMAAGMIKYMKSGPLFTAVGTAHLPGEFGIIALLRRAGYTVTVVPANFTGVASHYKVDDSKIQWFTRTDEGAGYSLQFPSEPIKTKFSGLNTLLYADLAHETYYGIYSIKKGTDGDPVNAQQVINNMLNSYKKNTRDNVITEKPVTVNGLKGIYVIMKNNDNYERIELFVNNNTLYILYAGSHLSSITNSSSNKFFSSFKTFKAVPVPEKSWITFRNDSGAFKIQMPFKPTELDKEIPNPLSGQDPFRLKMYLSSDTNSLNNYLVRYNDYPTGTYLSNSSQLFNGLGKEFGTKAKLLGNPIPIWKDGYEGREIQFLFADHYNCVVRMYVRGNRQYLIMQQNGHEDKPVTINKQFFDSFTFLPYNDAAISDYQPKGATYKIKLTVAPKVVPDTVTDYSNYLRNFTNYYTTNPMSGGVYYLEHSRLSKYYRADNIDSLYKDLADKLVTYKDSLIKTTTVSIGGKPAREVITINKFNAQHSRNRVLIDGNDVFFIGDRLVKDELFNKITDTILNSLVNTPKDSAINISASKAELITSDLQSKDTTTHNYALGAFAYYKFTAAELPYIYSALEKTYNDDTARFGARGKMIQVLKSTHNNQSVTQLLNLYPSLQGKDELKAEVINAIPTIDPKHGYDIYLKLLLGEKPLKLKNKYNLFSPLYDSLEYASVHFQQLLPLLNSSDYKSNIVSLCSRMTDKGNPGYDKLVKANFNLITKDCFKQLDEYLANKDTLKSEWRTDIYQYLKMMDSIKNEPVTNSFTNYYIRKNPKGVYFSDAVITRVDNGLPVNPVIINQQLSGLDTRYELMESLYTQKKSAIIPEKYKTPAEFGRLCLYKYILADDDDDDFNAPEKLVLLGSVQQNGSIYYAYQFTQTEREEGATYIGIAGPYKAASAKLDFNKYNAYTVYDKKKVNWKKQATGLIDGLKAQYADNKKAGSPGLKL